MTVLLRNGKADDENEWFVSVLTSKRVYSARGETQFTALSRAVKKKEDE